MSDYETMDSPHKVHSDVEEEPLAFASSDVASDAAVPEPSSVEPPVVPDEPVLAPEPVIQAATDEDTKDDEPAVTKPQVSNVPPTPSAAAPAASTTTNAKGSRYVARSRRRQPFYGLIEVDETGEKIWGWMTWKETLPGVIAITAAVGAFVVYSVMGVSVLRLVAMALLALLVAGGAIKANNRFLSGDVSPLHLSVKKSDVVCACDAVASVGIEALERLNRALSWENPIQSARALAYTWLVYRFQCCLGAPLLLSAVVLAFTLPALHDMLEEQLEQLWTQSVQPLVGKVQAQFVVVQQKAATVTDSQRMMIAGGLFAAVVLTAWLLTGVFGLFTILATVATLAAEGVVVVDVIAHLPSLNGSKKTN